MNLNPSLPKPPKRLRWEIKPFNFAKDWYWLRLRHKLWGTVVDEDAFVAAASQDWFNSQAEWAAERILERRDPNFR